MSIKFTAKIVIFSLLSFCLSFVCEGQSTAPSSSDPAVQTQPPSPTQGQAAPPAQQSPADKDKNKSETGSQGKVAGTSNDRLFYALPNFLTLENGGKLPPLSAKEKFKVVALGSFDPVSFPWWGVLAGIDQASNGNQAVGQGWDGYAKRYGITAGDSMIENFMVGAVFPSILHQDPRFYQSSNGGFARRTGYAVTRIVVTRGDSGHTQFNFSEIFGAGFAAAISSYTYHPGSTYVRTPTNPHEFIASERTFGNVVSTWEEQVGLDSLTYVVKEFWPDIHRILSHKKSVETVPSARPKP